jgi:DNA (cytosine-5)-methyltransferase 1
MGLASAVRLWPTPNAGSPNWGGTIQEWGGSKNWVRKEMPELAGGALNPMWVEWLMGWPLGWTDLNPLEMDKSHSVPQQPGDI